jgi:hypothetical protein
MTPISIQDSEEIQEPTEGTQETRSPTIMMQQESKTDSQEEPQEDEQEYMVLYVDQKLKEKVDPLQTLADELHQQCLDFEKRILQNTDKLDRVD